MIAGVAGTTGEKTMTRMTRRPFGIPAATALTGALAGGPA